MFAGLAESLTEGLGLKEGLAEFRGQLRKDGRALAEEKGVDLSKLDALEEKVAAKHEELRSAAFNALTKDETLAQLLDLKPGPGDASGEAPDQHPGGAFEHPASAAEAPTAAEWASSAPSTAAAAEVRGQALTSEPCRAASDNRATPKEQGAEVSSMQAPGAEQPAQAAKGDKHSQSSAQCRKRTPASLEAELQHHREVAETLKSELDQAKAQLKQLEARCGELSGISDDALSQTEELRRESSSWQQLAEERRRGLEAAAAEKEGLVKDLGDARRRVEELSAKPDRGSEPDGRVQELADQVVYLQKSLEVKEQKLQEVTKERAHLQQREVASKAVARDPEHGVMLDAHTAIAAAFGDSLSGSPLTRCIDEPLLRFTAVLFKQAFFRRAFYASSLLIWIFTLHHIIVAPHH